jgi:hypothetical protein
MLNRRRVAIASFASSVAIFSIPPRTPPWAPEQWPRWRIPDWPRWRVISLRWVIRRRRITRCRDLAWMTRRPISRRRGTRVTRRAMSRRPRTRMAGRAISRRRGTRITRCAMTRCRGTRVARRAMTRRRGIRIARRAISRRARHSAGGEFLGIELIGDVVRAAPRASAMLAVYRLLRRPRGGLHGDRGMRGRHRHDVGCRRRGLWLGGEWRAWLDRSRSLSLGLAEDRKHQQRADRRAT